MALSKWMKFTFSFSGLGFILYRIIENNSSNTTRMRKIENELKDSCNLRVRTYEEKKI